MKVALFHTTLPEPGRKLGGVELTVHRLANALVQYEHLDVTVFSSGAKPEDALYRHRIFARGLWRRRPLRLTVAPLALNFADFSEFDLLHLHGDDWFFVNRRIPTIRTMHGSALQEARTAYSGKRKLLQYAIYPLEHLSIRLATRSLAVGTEAARIYGISDLGDNGVDLERFKPQPKSATPLLCFIGSWRGRKRGEFAYRSFVDHVLPVYPEATLYMATDSAPEHPNVIRGGFPSDAELADWLSRAWVFAYPSSYEGFGIPYIEAMASGTAIVTTRNSGAEYVLGRERCGRITDDAEFGPALVSLLADAPERRRLEHVGLKYVQRFSWQNVAARHAEVYRSLLTEQASRAARPTSSETL